MSKRNIVMDFIRHQIGLDLTATIDERNSKRTYITVNDSLIDDIDMRRLKSLEHSPVNKYFRMESNGGLGIAIFLKK